MPRFLVTVANTAVTTPGNLKFWCLWHNTDGSLSGETNVVCVAPAQSTQLTADILAELAVQLQEELGYPVSVDDFLFI